MINWENTLIPEGMLPPSLQGWDTVKNLPLLSHSDLYSYMDGGAELYISYGFREAISRTYKKENQPEILAEIYDLTEPRNAFGVFSQSRETENLRLGQGGYSLPGAVFFWKNCYFVALSSWESTPELQEFILTLGNYIEKNIPVSGEIPAIMKLLPEEGMVPFGYVYFHHYVWLNSFYFISHDNVLLIDDNTDALLAKYTDQENKQYLLMIQYPDQDTACKAFNSFGEAFFPEGLVDHCILLEDNTWLAAVWQDNLITAVFNSTSRQVATRLIRQVLEKHRSIL